MGRRVNTGDVKTAGGPTTIAQLAREIPPGVAGPEGTAPTLMQREQEMLERCEAGIGMLQLAFWLAGKSLQVVRDAELYRATHDSFEAYCLERWDMKRNYANKLIRTWAIVEALHTAESAGKVPAGTTKKVNQGQVWELVGVAERWSVDAAAFVYRTVLETYGPRLTAAVLAEVVAVLDLEERFVQKTVGEQILAFLIAREENSTEEAADPIAARAAKAVPDRWIRSLAKKDTAAAAAYLDRVQAQIDTYRAELLTPAALPAQTDGERDVSEAA